jgi:hypothetical protein
MADAAELQGIPHPPAEGTLPLSGVGLIALPLLPLPVTDAAMIISDMATK